VVIPNDLHRYHLVTDVIEWVIKPGTRAAALRQNVVDAPLSRGRTDELLGLVTTNLARRTLD
jgi:phosphoketolase